MTDSPDRSDRIVRFGTFELDRQTGELRKSGLRIRVPDQSIQVLTLLAARPGDIVTREELAAALWPDGTNVDFENGLNAAVKKLRVALGDSGASPRFIETLPRRGYRLIVPISVAPASGPEVVTPARTVRSGFFRLNRVKAVAALGTIAALAGALSLASKRSSDTPPVAGGFGRSSDKAEANAYFAKAELFMGAGAFDPDRVVLMLERALQIDPAFGKARAEYGFMRLVRLLLGYTNEPSELYEAEEEIRHGLRDDPSFGHGFTALAAVYLHSGRKEQAPVEIEKALKLNPRDVDARHWLATYHWYSGDTAVARKLELENAARHPRFFPARMALGDLAREEGDWNGAIREYGQILEYNPQNGFVLERLALTHMYRGDLTQARQTLDRLPPADRRNFRTRAVEAVLLAREGRYPEAAAAMDPEALKYVDLISLFTLTGAEFYALMGNRTQALEWLERAVRQGDHRAAWFARNPALASLREDRQFRLIQSSVARQRPEPPTGH